LESSNDETKQNNPHNASRIIANDMVTISHPTMELSPIYGIFSVPTVSIDIAVQPFQNLVPDIEKTAKFTLKLKRFSNPPYNLTTDEAVAINLYTLESPVNKESSLYFVLNEKLREEDRSGIRPFFSYLKIFLSALKKLPKYKGIIWRGVNIDLHTKYKKNEEVLWWCFSSCSTEGEQIKQFLGKEKKNSFQHYFLQWC